MAKHRPARRWTDFTLGAIVFFVVLSTAAWGQEGQIPERGDRVLFPKIDFELLASAPSFRNFRYFETLQDSIDRLREILVATAGELDATRATLDLTRQILEEHRQADLWSGIVIALGGVLVGIVLQAFLTPALEGWRKRFHRPKH